MHEPSRAADALQADYFQEFLSRERAELLAEVTGHVKRLTLSMTTGPSTAIGHHRRCVRMAERQIRAIDRMLAALERRFSDGEVRRRA
ncbi:hypothetical protein [Mycolicibacterium pyrenivorans]|uniref:hypothetical protein n=1 Tax=Mycolicibacterium pyrenivorans TaxID=187102 RepID=UPI0021F27A5A|nr:hypothetical protein [Mycolicibacterium pyrenivorans]MCV7151888.1 hypothetical protein [Mycolicibacterium pyrenivorans]